MKNVAWRWVEKDFGFRFRSGKGKSKAEYYQAGVPGDFYLIPPAKRKLEKARMEDLAKLMDAPTSPRIVPSPWRNYEQHWDWIQTDDGLPLNYAGCLDREEIERREDEGVGRAHELIAGLVAKPEPVPLTIRLIQQIHIELMGEIYPFAGQWRQVDLHKGDGPTKWRFPPGGIQPLMDIIERDVFSRSPFISEDDDKIFLFASEVMNEILALHPFREGNGRTVFIVCNLIFLQNDLLTLSTYERRTNEDQYFEACEAGRIHRDYRPLADLLAEWEDEAIKRWENENE